MQNIIKWINARVHKGHIFETVTISSPRR